jgi:hypothetical protein
MYFVTNLKTNYITHVYVPVYKIREQIPIFNTEWVEPGFE